MPLCVGSPPQVRGKLKVEPVGISEQGITPAGAGKTQCQPRTAFSTQDHPRRCGENLGWRFYPRFIIGSPPQVRGKHNPIKQAQKKIRITPAGAGKTATAFLACKAVWDHPRRCGENVIAIRFQCLTVGSPPQVRGKPRRTPCRVLSRGITPAGAGKTRKRIKPDSYLWDHPRRCGENLLPAFPLYVLLGSPPQVRGKRDVYYNPETDERITPAGAGKTCSPLIRLRLRRGSPPQVRGKRENVQNAQNEERITPAGAGKTAAVRE